MIIPDFLILCMNPLSLSLSLPLSSLCVYVHVCFLGSLQNLGHNIKTSQCGA
jgi:hypothetical protein